MPRLRRRRSPGSQTLSLATPASGQAIVNLSGKDFYLGPHGTKVSHLEYDRVVAEWLARGRSAATRPTDSEPRPLPGGRQALRRVRMLRVSMWCYPLPAARPLNSTNFSGAWHFLEQRFDSDLTHVQLQRFESVKGQLTAQQVEKFADTLAKNLRRALAVF